MPTSPRFPLCPAGTLQECATTVTMERDGATAVFKHVPAGACNTCREAHLNEDVSARVYEQAEAAVEAGLKVDVRRYDAPANAPA